MYILNRTISIRKCQAPWKLTFTLLNVVVHTADVHEREV